MGGRSAGRLNATRRSDRGRASFAGVSSLPLPFVHLSPWPLSLFHLQFCSFSSVSTLTLSLPPSAPPLRRSAVPPFRRSAVPPSVGLVLLCSHLVSSRLGSTQSASRQVDSEQLPLRAKHGAAGLSLSTSGRSGDWLCEALGPGGRAAAGREPVLTPARNPAHHLRPTANPPAPVRRIETNMVA